MPIRGSPARSGEAIRATEGADVQIVAPHRSRAHIGMVDQQGLRLERPLNTNWLVPWCQSEWGLLVVRQEQSVFADRGLDDWSWPRIRIEHISAFDGSVFVAGKSRDGRPELHRRRFCAGSEWIDSYPLHFEGRKQIDALVVVGDKLIAVDNIVMPKFSFVFGRADDPPQVIEMAWNGTYEEIIAASCWDRKLLVLSSTVGQMGQGRHLMLTDANVRRSAVFTAFRQMAFRGTEQGAAAPAFEAMMSAASVASSQSRIVLGCRDQGIVVVDPIGMPGGETEWGGNRRDQPEFLSFLPLDQLPWAAGAEDREMPVPSSVEALTAT